jgi:imidazolonepropionase-like amidohydrolase
MPTFTIHTDLLFDSKRKAFVSNTSITVDTNSGLVNRVYSREEPLPKDISPPDVDLRGKAVLPGFVDAHTHIFLHAYSDTPAVNQMRDESLVERVIRATNHCRIALLAGYTTYRDLGTEGLQHADVNVRDSINRGIIPGPRLFVATEALASSGGYAIRHENHMGGVRMPQIADVADGVDGVRAAVRRRIGAGADVIKFYADYRKRTLRFPPSQWPGASPIQFPPQDRNPDHLLFTQQEIRAMVEEAKTADCPVAAHCMSSAAVMMAAKAGVTTVEHGFEPSEDALRAMKMAGAIYVPTLAVYELFYPMDQALRRTKKAFDEGIKIACGGDTGAFAHGDNAREMELMLEAGVPMEEVLTSATLHGWEACGGEKCGRKFDWLEEGVAADVVALDSDPRDDVGALRKVSFVMKDAKVWKRDGLAVGMV